MSRDFGEKYISVLGSAGSIGRQALSVCEQSKGQLRVAALASLDEVEEVARQAWQFKPALVALADESKYSQLKAALQGLGCRIEMGEAGVCEAASFEQTDCTLGAISGIAGLKPVYTAICAGKQIALANKEVLVTGGELIMSAAERHGVELLPVDSEHSALWQCLHRRKDEVSRLIITASGGAFYGYSQERLIGVTAAEALRHPTWKMGPKITVDCANLINKGFEIIEAHYLFDMPYDCIMPVIHRESIIHSMVEYRDGAVLALLSQPDMRLAIQYALTYPLRFSSPIERLDFTHGMSLSLRPCNIIDYPCLELALSAAKQGAAARVVLNATNEVLNASFRRGEIGFMQIASLLERVLAMSWTGECGSIEDILLVDKEARQAASRCASEAAGK